MLYFRSPSALRNTALVLIWTMLLPACATNQQFSRTQVPANQMHAYLAGRPQQLHPPYRRILEEGKRNLVLNNLKLGLDAYQLGYKADANSAFDRAIQGINTVYADNPDAAKARSLWYEEGQKDYKGEPYERAMAFYYRGLLDLEAGDYENARASFKSGILQDAFAEEDQNRCDFASLIFMEGWASLANGDLEMADYAFEEVKKLRPDFVKPTDQNVLILIETGTSPRKVSDGPGHSELKFRRGRNFVAQRALYTVDNGPFAQAYPIEDIFWQAASRGGRPVDKILQGKAVFRSKNDRIGTSLSDASDDVLLASTALTAVPVVMGVGAALGLVSITHLALAARSRAQADTRYWDNLPDTLYIAMAKIPAGRHQVQISYLDKFGGPVTTLRSSREFTVPEKGHTLLWFRAKPVMSKDDLI